MLSNYTLVAHDKGYQLSFYEFCAFPFSSPYAARHGELSQTGDEAYRFGHKIIAVVEGIPILGAFASLLERMAALAIQVFTYLFARSGELSNSIDSVKDKTLPVIHKISQPSPDSPQVLTGNQLQDKPDAPIKEMPSEPIADPQTLPVTEPVPPLIEPVVEKPSSSEDFQKLAKSPEERMLKNLRKALAEHRAKQTQDKASIDSLVVGLSSPAETANLSFNVFEAALQGRRPSMEDAHFQIKLADGYLLGICDGHGDRGKISNYISTRCQQLFSEVKEKFPTDMAQVFTSLFAQIHQEVIEKQIAPQGGSTAVVCFIEKHTNRVYVATLGDSEAKVIRPKGSNQYEAIPLSCVRDWSSVKDAKRASLALKNESIAANWPKAANSKYLRFPSPFYGLNVSRSIGDEEFNEVNGQPGVIQKPKVTVFQLQKSDLLIIACDGVWDYAQNDDELIEAVIKPYWQDFEVNIAEVIARYSLDQKSSQDNISVLALYTS